MHSRFQKRNDVLNQERLGNQLKDELKNLGSLMEDLDARLDTRLRKVSDMDLIECSENLKLMQQKSRNCDGCSANMPIKESNMLGKTVKMHVNEKGQTHMICSASLYGDKQKK